LFLPLIFSHSFPYPAGEAMISLPIIAPNRSAASPALFNSKQTRWAIALALPLVVGPVWCLAWQSQSHWLGTLSGFVLLAVLAVSAITDVREHKIFNWATYSAMLWALAINGTASLLSAGESLSRPADLQATVVGPAWLGGVGMGQCLIGAAICFTITLAGYHMSGGGAGDVKLAMVIGALLGIQQGAFAVATSYIVAAVAIIVWTIYTNGPLALLKAAARTLGTLLGPLWPFPPTLTDSELLMQPIPLGPYFAIGTLLVILELVPS
jgi:Flp pilus assembly protein protease CpaA